MKTFCMIIGSIVVSVVFIAIPILLSVSLCLGWGLFFSLMFAVGTLIEFIIIFEFILAKNY